MQTAGRTIQPMFRKLIASKALRRRTSWIIAGILLLPFAIFGAFQASPGRGSGGSAGVLFGKAVPWATFEEQRAWLLTQWRNQFGNDLETLGPLITQSTWDRLILLEEAKRRRLRVDDRELASVIHTIPAFQDEGRFIPERYHRYVSAVGSSPQAFERLLRSDLLIEKLVNSVKASVVITEDDVRQAYARQHEQLKATVMFFETSAFHAAASAAVSEDQLRAAYDAHPEVFRVPEQIVIEYAGVSHDTLASRIQLDDQTLRAFYETHPDDFAKEDGSLKPFDEVRETVRQRLTDAQVRQQLVALAIDLEEDMKSKRPLVEIAKVRALLIEEAGPFRVGDPGIGEGLDPAIRQAVASLAEGQMSDVIETDRGVYLAHVTKRIPSHVQPFEEIEEQLREQLIQAQTKDLARARANALRDYLQEQLKTGARFEEAVLAHGTIPITPASFTRTGPIDPIGTFPAVNEEAFRTPLGSLTDVLETPIGFVLIRPEESIPADVSNFAAVEPALRQETLAEEQAARVNQWLTDLRARATLRSFVDSPF